MPSAVPLLVPDVDRDVLCSWTRSPSLAAGLVLRARIVLAAAGGESNTSIAERLGVTRQTVVSWRGPVRHGGPGRSGGSSAPRPAAGARPAGGGGAYHGGPAEAAGSDALVVSAAGRGTGCLQTTSGPGPRPCSLLRRSPLAGSPRTPATPQHRHQEFLAFLKQVAKAHPRVVLHVVCDNYATHKTPEVAAWLGKHPRITLHFTPTSGVTHATPRSSR